MSALRERQAQLRAYLLDGTPGIERHVVGTAKADAHTRLDIYGDGYALRLIECLQKDFPALAALMGDDAFAALARAYIAQHPSRHFSVRYVGARLAEFVRARADADAPLHADLAAFEWALMNAFDAPDTRVATVADMAAVAPTDWPLLRFACSPSLQRMALRSHAPTIWKAADRGEDPHAASAALSEVATPWIVWRQELRVYFRSLTPAEAWALDATRADADFAELCEGLCEWHAPEAVAIQAAGMLKQWLTDGLIERLILPQSA